MEDEDHSMTYGENPDQPTIYDFPTRGGHYNEARMNNIIPVSLPNFHGITSEEPDTFLFEFEAVFRTYVYTMDPQKLNLFP